MGVENLTEYIVPLNNNQDHAYQIGSTKGSYYFTDTYIQFYYSNRVIQSRSFYFNGSYYDLTLSDNNIYEYKGGVLSDNTSHPWYSIYKLSHL